ncbi:hypothetical protein IJV79_03280 [bacterium]|nr:hypothetical protein [bacterium]
MVKNVDDETKVLKAPLSAKLKAGLNSVKGWAFGFAAVGVLMRARDVLLNKNEKYAQFEEKNPVLSLLSQIGGLAVGYSAIKTVGKKLSIGEKLSQKMAPITKKFGNLGQKIDNSKFGTRLMELGESFVNSVKTKNPALAKTGTFLLANSVLLLLIGGCLKLSKDAKEVQKNYEHLKSVQNELKQTINK